MEPPTLYLPDYAMATIDQMLKVFTRLDRGRMPCDLVPLRENQEIELSRELVVTDPCDEAFDPRTGFHRLGKTPQT